MRRNVHQILAVTSIIISLFLVCPVINTAHAGAPPLKGCEDRKNRPVETEYNKRLPSFAKVEIIKSPKGERFIILVNPTHYFLSRETQQWLYFRQCAHIQLNHQTIRVKNNEPNLREERAADCWAIERMLFDKKYRFSERGISKIQRDIEQIERKRELWQDIFGGPRRRVYTFDCIHSKTK